MTIFEAVKTTVAPRMAAEHFGLSVSRNGMVCCPFHDDRHPSMKDIRVEAKREVDNVLLFMRSEGYIQLKSDSTITSADLYAIYTMWCNDNTYKPLAVRTVSMTLKKHADEFGLEHDNHIQNALGKRVNGFWGIEALVAPPVV